MPRPIAFYMHEVRKSGMWVSLIYQYNYTKQVVVFFVRCDWLLKLGIVFAIHLLALFWILLASLSLFFRIK